MYTHICSFNDLRSCTFRCRIAISERGGHIVAVFREETPSLKIARVAVMEMGNLQLQSMTSLHNFLFKSDVSSPHFSHRIVKVLDFTVKRPVTFNLLPLKLFDSFNTFQWEIELIFILMFLLFEGRCTTQQAGGAIICLVPNDYIWDYPQDVRAFFQPGEEIRGHWCHYSDILRLSDARRLNKHRWETQGL